MVNIRILKKKVAMIMLMRNVNSENAAIPQAGITKNNDALDNNNKYTTLLTQDDATVAMI
tara:strand:+ start:314 stop:493 length:180 start_codon:yes stop_codon:yes gene_type:complete